MPKVFLTNEDRAVHRFALWVRGEKQIQKVSDTELAEGLGITQQAMSRKIRLGIFDMKDFAYLVVKLGMDMETLKYILDL